MKAYIIAKSRKQYFDFIDAEELNIDDFPPIVYPSQIQNMGKQQYDIITLEGWDKNWCEPDMMTALKIRDFVCI